MQEIIEKYVQTAGAYYRSFDTSRPDGLSPRIDIVQGDSIIVDPNVGQGDGKCWKATKENLLRFQANGYAFVRHWSAENRKTLDNIGTNWARPFGSAFDKNLLSTPLPYIPDFKLPWRMKLFRMRFREACDATNECHAGGMAFPDFLKNRGIVPNYGSGLDARDLDALKGANIVRIYELRRAGVLFRVVAAFATPTDADGTAKEADAATERAVLDFVKLVKDANDEKPTATFVVIGTPKGWTIPPSAVESRSDFFEMRVSPPVGLHKCWDVASPPFGGAGRVYRDFIYSLLPETENERKARIDGYLKDYFNGVAGKSRSVAEVAADTGDPEELVSKAFDELVSDKSGYDVGDVCGVPCIHPGTNRSHGGKFWKASRYGREKRSWLARNVGVFGISVAFAPPLLAATVAKLVKCVAWLGPYSLGLTLVLVGIVQVLKTNMAMSGEDD